MSARPPVKLLVTDLDNTLWNWFDIWYAQFSTLLSELAKASGIDQEVLEQESRPIHQRNGTSEYTFLIRELPILQDRFPGEDLEKKFAAVLSAARHARRERMLLYPTVYETLQSIKQSGTTIVAYTESLAYWSQYRIRRFDLDCIIDFLYSPEDHAFPSEVTRDELRTMDSEEYEMRCTEQRFTPKNHLKPDTEILQSILDEFADDPESVVYVGDSLMKDIPMAQRVGVHDVYAEYGTKVDPKEYELLQKVSHWTQDDVDREKEIKKQSPVNPSFTLDTNLAQLLELFEFIGHD